MNCIVNDGVIDGGGARYWFDDAETEQMMRHNRQFQQVPSAMQHFLEYFEPGMDDNGRWLTAAAILQELKQSLGSVFQVPSVITFGRQLHGLESLQRHRSRNGEVYYVQTREKD